jgi:hypothetical protein
MKFINFIINKLRRKPKFKAYSYRSFESSGYVFKNNPANPLFKNFALLMPTAKHKIFKKRNRWHQRIWDIFFVKKLRPTIKYNKLPADSFDGPKISHVCLDEAGMWCMKKNKNNVRNR